MKKGEPLSPFDEQKLHLHKRPKWAVKNACMGYAHGESHGMCYLEDEVRHGLQHLFHLWRVARVHAIVLLEFGEHYKSTLADMLNGWAEVEGLA